MPWRSRPYLTACTHDHGSATYGYRRSAAMLEERAIYSGRAPLVADPKAVFARELGLDVPDMIAVQVLEETLSTVYLVLPPAIAGTGAELSDAELESVAGGWTGFTNECGSCAGGPDSNCCDHK